MRARSARVPWRRPPRISAKGVASTLVTVEMSEMVLLPRYGVAAESENALALSDVVAAVPLETAEPSFVIEPPGEGAPSTELVVPVMSKAAVVLCLVRALQCWKASSLGELGVFDLLQNVGSCSRVPTVRNGPQNRSSQVPTTVFRPRDVATAGLSRTALSRLVSIAASDLSLEELSVRRTEVDLPRRRMGPASRPSADPRKEPPRSPLATGEPMNDGVLGLATGVAPRGVPRPASQASSCTARTTLAHRVPIGFGDDGHRPLDHRCLRKGDRRDRALS